MEKEFIPYEQALDLKELGFDEPCFGCYTEKKEVIIRVGDYRSFLNNLKTNKIMEIVQKSKNKRIHHSLAVNEITYFRNEDLEFNFEKNKWEREKLRWSIGNKKGEGPYVEPKGPLDEIGEYTSQELEEMFKKKYIMNKIQVTRPVFLINLDNPIEVSYEPMESNWKTVIAQTYQHGFPEIKDDEILYVFKENITSDITKNDRGYILKTNKIMENTNLNNEQVKNPLREPLNHSLEDLLKEIQFGRPAETQLQIQKWINELTQEKLLGKTISKEVADKDSFEEVQQIPNPADFMQLGEDAFNKNVHEKLRETLSANEKQMWISGYLLALTQQNKR